MKFFLIRLICFSILFLGLSPLVFGQADQRHWLAPTHLSKEDIPVRRLPVVDNSALLHEEMQARRPGRAPVFAVPFEVDIAPQKNGIWEILEDGRLVWRLGLTSQEAHSLNFGFSSFHLPEGAVLLIYDKKQEHVLGPFSRADEDYHGTFWTPILPGDEATIELQLPSGTAPAQAELHLKYVNHDFAGLEKVLSGTCHIDVACASDSSFRQLAAFREAIQSVVFYTLKGNINCSGFLINNSSNDCRPYLVTARHCEVDSASAASMVVYWNYQNSTCRQPGSTVNGRAGNGPLNQINSGAIFRAAHQPSDIALVELDDPLHPAANAFFLGWNLDTLFPADGVAAIHHASAQEKRISYSALRPYLGLWGQGATPVPTGNHLIISRWELGATEDGSSGGPLINRRQQALGALHGGASACGNQLFDAFGWLGTAWEGGGTSATRLKDWLDPASTGRTSWPGRWAARCQKAIETDSNVLVVCNPGSTDFRIKVNTLFRGEVELRIAGMPPHVDVRLEKRILRPGESTRLLVQALPGAIIGRFPLQLIASDSEDTVSLVLLLDLKAPPASPVLLYPQSGQTEVPIQPVLNWKAVPDAANYYVVLAADSGFQEILQEFFVTTTSVRADSLSYLTTYYWSVQALNSCGTGPVAQATFTTAPDLRLELRNLPGEICNRGDLRFELFIGNGFGTELKIEYLPNDGPSLPIELTPKRPLPGQVVTGTIYNLDLIDLDTYVLSFRLSDGVRVALAQHTIRVKAAPSKVSLDPGLQDTAFVSPQPLLRWAKAPERLSYVLEISKTPDFSAVVQRHSIQDKDQQQLAPLDPGRYFWRIFSANECGQEVSETGRFSVHNGSLSELFHLKIALDPNPTAGRARVLFSDPVRETGVYLYGITGQLLQQQESSEERSSYDVDLSAYPSGTYLLRIRYRQSSVTRLLLLHR